MDCPEMVTLPMGQFVKGAPVGQSAHLYLLWHKPEPGKPVGFAYEGPEHVVVIDQPIAMGRNELTRAGWMAVVAHGGCTHRADPTILQLGGALLVDDPRHPVIDVSYADALEYVAWLNDQTDTRAYCLPTEAAWESAARAGTTTRCAQSDRLTVDQANVGNFHRDGDRYDSDKNNRSMPVVVDALDATNAWGLRHMAGNVLEPMMSCWAELHLGSPTSSAYLEAAQQAAPCERVPKVAHSMRQQIMRAPQVAVG